MADERMNRKSDGHTTATAVVSILSTVGVELGKFADHIIQLIIPLSFPARSISKCQYLNIIGEKIPSPPGISTLQMFTFFGGKACCTSYAFLRIF
jgi:hypothetical protein